jgi:hypothetical protein
MSIDLRTRQGFDDIKRILDDRPDDVLAMCRIKIAPRRGATIVIDDPRGQGRGNFAIWLKADGLSWKNYTSDEKGRSLELIAYCQGWYHLQNRGGKEAARFAMERLGLGNVPAEQLARDRMQAAVASARDATRAAAELDRRRRSAFATFINARPVLDTPAETYLREIRGIDLRAAPFIGPRGGNIAPGPCALSPSINTSGATSTGAKVSGEPAPVPDRGLRRRQHEDRRHAPDISARRRPRQGRARRPRPTARRSRRARCWGIRRPCDPAVARRGPSERQGSRRQWLLQTLILTEGVEDGLSAVLAAPHRVWAMISLSNMANVAPRLPECIEA